MYKVDENRIKKIIKISFVILIIIGLITTLIYDIKNHKHDDYVYKHQHIQQHEN